VTVCAHNRACVFGEIVNGEMRLNDAGRMVHAVWEDLPHHYAGIELDAFVVMPNHVHGIIFIVGAGFKPAPTKYGLPEIVRGFKTFSSRRINESRGEQRPVFITTYRLFGNAIITNTSFATMNH
jgi:putative transposase